MWRWCVRLTHVSLPNKLIFIIVARVFSSGDFWRPSDGAALPHKGTLSDGSILGGRYLRDSACVRQRRVMEESFITLLQISINNTASVRPVSERGRVADSDVLYNDTQELSPVWDRLQMTGRWSNTFSLARTRWVRFVPRSLRFQSQRCSVIMLPTTCQSKYSVVYM